MHTHNLLPHPRLVASGGPVTRALAVCRADAIEAERARLRELRGAILRRIAADLGMIERVEHAVAVLPRAEVL